jgi:putative methyltransferase (TIGR04325 family)
VTLRYALKWTVKAVTPPILVLAAKTVLVRLGLWKVPAPAPSTPPPAEPAEWEYVPEAWARRVPGWDAGTVAEAYGAKWPQYVAALGGRGPLGVYHEARAGEPIRTDDLGAHNTVMAFAYVLARAAHGAEQVSVLDWGGGVGHYHALARVLLPEVELEWHCREVPSVAAVGRELSPEVRFHEDDSCLERRYDLVLASSSLQYVDDWAGLLAGLAGATGRFLYVTRLPVALESDSFVVLQRAHAYGYATEYLGWVIARDALLAGAVDSGLELVQELLIDGLISAAGAPEAPVVHRGFLFRPAPETAVH